MNPILLYEEGKSRKKFITTWDTTIVNTGTFPSSNANQIKLPFLLTTGQPDCVVNWGDGVIDHITDRADPRLTHTYATPGIQTITITGKIHVWSFVGQGDREKLLTITSWGILNINGSGMFQGCNNLNLSAVTDVPSVIIGDISSLFQSCTILTTINKLNEWNMVGATDINGMFFASPNFNQDIGAWNVSNVTSTSSMFQSATAFNNGGSPSINNWNVSKVTTMANMFRSSAFNQNIGSWNTSLCTTFTSMFQQNTVFNNGGSPNITNWNVSKGTVFTSMFNGATAFNQPLNSWVLNTTTAVNMSSMFSGATAFNCGQIALSTLATLNNWNTSKVTTFATMFNNTPAFNGDISSWDTSSVTSMFSMFDGGAKFNRPIGGWNTINVLNMANMFAGDTLFNQNIGNWNTAKVTDMSFMFNGTGQLFNNGETTNLGLNPLNWVTTALTTLSNTFRGSKFNQPINTAGGFWDVSNVTTFANIFTDTPFNQPIGAWNVSKSISFANMFDNADAFNQDINAWQFATTGTINFTSMFLNQQNFNCGKPVGDPTATLNNWNVDRVTNMSSMFFGNKAFNGDISNWKTGNVTTTGSMFNACTTFNKPIPYNLGTGAWDMSKNTAIGNMFFNAIAFNQNVGSWNLIACNSYVTFLGGKTPATFLAANLDAIYNGWIAFKLLPIQSFSAGTAKYTAAATEGRNLLTRANATPAITAIANASGLFRLSVVNTLANGNKVYVEGGTSYPTATGLWTVSNVTGTTIDLVGSTFAGAFNAGGTVRTGYGWTIVDGGI